VSINFRNPPRTAMIEGKVRIVRHLINEDGFSISRAERAFERGEIPLFQLGGKWCAYPDQIAARTAKIRAPAAASVRAA
jgi:hypothetical protein